MKTSRILPCFSLFVVLGPWAGLALRAADDPKAVSRTQVIFFEPERFTDVADSYMHTDKGRDAILGQIREFVEQRAARFVSEGQKLSVTFTDIDLAGDFEPWRGLQSQDIRIVKDIYPPRMTLSFKLTDADGTVIKQGERKLTDLSFMMNIDSINSTDPLHYEKTLLNDWFQSEFTRTK
jgi:hypothetical protein